MNSEVTLELSEVVVCRGAQSLGPVSLKIQRGECSSLVGANGSGKSSILEAVAGFLQVESGTIRIGGKTISDEGTGNEPWQRGIGWLGQQRGLWPHMTLREQAQLLSGQKTAGQLEETAAALDLQTLLDRRPDQLSGGEAQRGELLRTLCGSAPCCFWMSHFLHRIANNGSGFWRFFTGSWRLAERYCWRSMKHCLTSKPSRSELVPTARKSPGHRRNHSGSVRRSFAIFGLLAKRGRDHG